MGSNNDDDDDDDDDDNEVVVPVDILLLLLSSPSVHVDTEDVRKDVPHALGMDVVLATYTLVQMLRLSWPIHWVNKHTSTYCLYQND